MREILTLSLPPQTKQLIKKKSKMKGFSSVSSYIQYLIKQEDDLISEEELIAEAKKAKREYKSGKLKELKSLNDLM